MPANRVTDFTEYGLGWLRRPHDNPILTRKPVCDCFEIISENFFCFHDRADGPGCGFWTRYWSIQVVQHGVSMYFGPRRRRTRHLAAIEGIGQADEDPLLSDHLCWGSVTADIRTIAAYPDTFDARRDGAESVARCRLS